MVTPWRAIKGAEPGAVKVARRVLNGGDEDTCRVQRALSLSNCRAPASGRGSGLALGHFPSRGPQPHVCKANAARQALFLLAKMKQEERRSPLLEIPDAWYAALQAAADAHGTTPLGWIAAHLPHAPEPAGAPKTLAALCAGRVGRIGSGGPERLSEACGEKCTDYVEAKRSGGCW